MPATILYVITELDIGGAEKALFELVRRLDRDRYAVEVACLTGRGAVGGWLRGLHVPVHFLRMPPGGFRPWQALLAERRLRRIIRELRPDIVHTVLFHANLLGRLAARRGLFFDRPGFVSGVRVAERRHRWHLIADHLTHRLMDVEVCVSEGVRHFTETAARIPAHKLRVIPNGVDLAAIDAVKPVDLVELGCLPDVPAVCFVGRLDPQKGLGDLLHAVHELHRREILCQLVLVGQGPQRAELEALARSLGIAEWVHFLGWRADAPAVMAACEVFVMPSLWEGMPNAVMEAMALGRCVVATAVEGTSELIVDGESGLLVPPQAPHLLMHALADALAEPALRDRLGRAARRRIAAHFTIEQTVAQYDALYQQLLQT